MTFFKKHVYLVLCISLLISAFNFANHLPNSYQKKVNKQLELIWPEKEITLHVLTIQENRIQKANEIGIQDVYQLLNNKNIEGYMVHAKVPSKFDNFDIAIFYSNSFEIKSMKVLAYREDHGGEVGSKRWLKQFIGKSTVDPISLYEDIQGISGATISCVSATVGAKKITDFMSSLNLY